ncbi:MAG: hypothetical protein ABL901_02840 [Hyphomicrobiaceae bacterium]|nr:hypothetical protein [Hyphomicrobiaceae bacterium]
MTKTYSHPVLKPIFEIPGSIRVRVAIERTLCKRVIRALFARGYQLRVHSGDDWETPRCIQASDEDDLMQALFNLDEAHLVVYKGKARAQFGWVKLVFGNDGWDVISDYTVNLEGVLTPVNDHANRLSERWS